ncbi:ANTH domain-containing protein, partial [Cephalotus follicularis]
MAAGGGTQQSLRKAIGAIKDSTKVGLANLNSENKELDVAIVKATNHDEVLPKEKHVRTIFGAVSGSRPPADVAYCLNGLAKRLAKTHNWTVALKTLIVIHRALRETDSAFHEELSNYTRGRGHMLNLSHFRDDSCPQAWDYSAWVRTYALYLEERLECFHILKYDVEKNLSRTKELDTPDMLDQLPALQQLLHRLLSCKPEGASMYNGLIHYALSIVAGESVRLYVAITDGILNLVDKYFEMQRHDAFRALEIYRKSENQAEKLSEFFEICRGLDFGRGQKFVKIEQPPASFVTTMENYLKEAPQTLLLQYQDADAEEITAPKETANSEPGHLLIDYELDVVNVQEKSEQSDPPKSDQSEASVKPQVTDLLGLDELTQEASEMDEKNCLALAIVSSENPSNPENGLDMICPSSNWELALVTAPSTNGAAAVVSKLVGGLDKSTLDSLYDDAMSRRANQSENYMGQASSNPFEDDYCHNQDPFYVSSDVAPPTDVQMAAMAQHHAFIMQQQQQQQQLSPVVDHHSYNPFGNPFAGQSF